MTPETDDPSVERFARVTPPAGHEARVRARSGPGAPRATASGPTRSGVIAWRWVLPVVASALVVVGAMWQSDRTARSVWLHPPAASDEWGGKGVDVPVLPPRAYWEMSALDEFERLRATAPLPRRDQRGHQRERDSAHAPDLAVRRWTPLPSSLPPIVIEDIPSNSIEIPPIAGAAPITMAPIEIEPIDIASSIQEDK